MTNIFYILSFSAKHCLLQVRVNDLLAYAEDVVGEVTLDLPVNHLIPATGIQEMLCKIKPNLTRSTLASDFAFDGEMKCVSVDSKTLQTTNERLLFEFHFDAFHFPSEALSFFADVPYDLDFWNNAQNLTRQKKLENQLADAYQRLNELLRQRQYERFLDEFVIHDNNYAQTMCWNMPQEISQKRNHDFVALLAAGFVLKQPMSDMCIEMYGYGYFVRPCGVDGNTALLLWHPETGEEYPLDLYFRKLCNSDSLTLI